MYLLLSHLFAGDNVEILLFTSPFIGYCFPQFHKNISICLYFSLVVHFWLGGVRWQLFLIYVATILHLYSNGILADNQFLFHILSSSGSLFLCVLFPILPVAAPDINCVVGIQDICLNGKDGKFWTRIFYPSRPRTNLVNKKPIVRSNFVISSFVLLLGYYLLLLRGPTTISEAFIMFPIYLLIVLPELLFVMAGYEYVPYLPIGDQDALLSAIASFGGAPTSFIFSHYKCFRLCCIKDGIYCNRQAMPSTNERNGPLKVAVVMHGLGGTRFAMTETCTKLAKDGYLVLAPEFADGTASLTHLPGEGPKPYLKFDFSPGESWESERYRCFRNTQLQRRCREVNTVLYFLRALVRSVSDPAGGDDALAAASSILEDVQWKGNLDDQDTWLRHSTFLKSISALRSELDTPVLLGHSFGASTALHLAMSPHSDAASFRSAFGVKAVVAFDPWMFPLEASIRDEGSLPAPFLCLHAERWGDVRDDVVIVERSRAALLVLVRDTCHLNYSDMCFTSPVLQCWLWKNLGKHAPLALLESINSMVTDFLHSVHRCEKSCGDEVMFDEVLERCQSSYFFRLLRAKT